MQDCFPRWVLPDLVNIILDYSKELPVKRVHLEQDTITNDDIPLDVTNLIISNCTNFQVTDEFENSAFEKVDCYEYHCMGAINLIVLIHDYLS